MEPVNDLTRNAVWGTLTGLQRNVRYYTALADRYRSFYRAIRFLILFGIVLEGAILFIATTNPWLFWAGGALGLGLAALTVWDVISDYAENSAVLRITAFTCDDLILETEALWRQIDSGRIETSEAEALHLSIVRRWASATQRVTTATHNSLNESTTEDAYQAMVNQHAT